MPVLPCKDGKHRAENHVNKVTKIRKSEVTKMKWTEPMFVKGLDGGVVSALAAL